MPTHRTPLPWEQDTDHPGSDEIVRIDEHGLDRDDDPHTLDAGEDWQPGEAESHGIEDEADR